jgi:hypothetical protein
MSGFPKKERQRIIDGYLAATGRNMFQPAEFIDWLESQTDHEAYEWFFATDDKTAAREYRIGLARRMASGLRIVVEAQKTEAKVIQFSTREYPAYVSPVAGRRDGGGYSPFDPNDAALMAELQCQGAQALLSWLARYRGAALAAGVDVNPIERIAEQLRPQEAKTA